MHSFTSYNPTKIIFGRQAIDKLANELAPYGKRILLILGKNSAKKYGYYEAVMQQLTDFEVVEYEGIKPNPVLEDAEAAIALGRQHKSEIVLALGGGSVIDSAKFIAVGISNNFELWDFATGKAKPTAALPVFSILTLAATGTEMNAAAVIQSERHGEKTGMMHPLMYPKASFLDPEYTISVPNDYTAYGLVDIMAHALEAYFGPGEPTLTDMFTFDILRATMLYGPLVLKHPHNYDYRAQVMLTATCALNGITNYGKGGGDWGVHEIGHTLSLLFDVPHGASLSIAYPAWLKLHSNRIPKRISKLGMALWSTDFLPDIIERLEAFWTSIGSPVRMSQVGIGPGKHEEILASMTQNKISGYHHKLTHIDWRALIELMA